VVPCHWQKGGPITVANDNLVNRGGEPAKIALGLLKLTVPSAVHVVYKILDVIG
jgi:hypothetical protein